MSTAPLVLPEGGLYALTWSIPHQFGGLTKSMLQRSCQLATASGREVTVITLAPKPDLDDDRSSLRERGLLVDGVSILNLWEELGRADDDIWETAPFDRHITGPELDPEDDDVTDLLRPDGTVLARQRRQTFVEDGEPQRGEVVRTEIWDRSRSFLGGWHGVWPLWRWWLDGVIPRPAHLIIDSAFVANCFAAVPLVGVSTTYVVHNNHIAGSRDAPYGRLERWRSFAIVRAHRFDAVVHLTEAQRHDVDLLFGRQDNAHVVPHGIEPATSSNRRRSAGRGIIMSNLEARKRIPHAIRAVATAATEASGVELAIYGRGPEQAAIEEEIDLRDAPARLVGYTDDPGGAFADSSYSLLTSSREGFGLVLVESMAAGCLPIAYDIEYGPADIIHDGVDGFLVPRGDEEALAAQIAAVASASRRRLRRMRKAARRRAADFLPAAVLPRWTDVFESAAARAQARAGDPEPTLDEVRELERVSALYRFPGCHLEAEITKVTWNDNAVATVDMTCTLVGAAADLEPQLTVELIHRASGRRAPAPAIEILGTDAAAPDSTAFLRISIDPSTVEQPADHVVVVRARLGDIDVLDTPQPPPETPEWLPLPVATPSRPVLIPARRSGLRLATASPQAAASVELMPDGALLDVAALGRGATVKAVEAQGVNGEPRIESDRQDDGRYRLTVSAEGLWKVRAKIEGRWRDVAWRGPEPVPPGDGPVRIELSPRGYLRLRRGD